MRTAEIVGSSCEDIRGLDEDVARAYGIQLQYANDSDGNAVPVRFAFKYPDNVKYRGYDEKKFWLKNNSGLVDLFGPDFNAGSSKRIYITEGEFDAASLFQVLGKSYPVKSLPSASWSDKLIKKNYDYLNSFKEIVYAGELDDAGRASAEKLYAVFPEKFYFVSMTKWKDANEFLTKGDGDTLKWSALKPQRYTPDNFYVGEEAIEHAIRTENPYQYTPTGHVKFDEKLRGLVRGGLTFIKAPRGTGKCLAPNTPVVLSTGKVKEAKDLVVGDTLLGPDSKPRNVLSTTTGTEEMFKVVPVKGEPWVCNSSHILNLYNYDKRGYVNITAGEFYRLSRAKQARYVQHRASAVKFSGQANPVYDPYFVGMYLGDGSKHSSAVTLGGKKAALLEYLGAYVKSNGWSLTEETQESNCSVWHIVTGTRGGTSPMSELRKSLFLDGEKFIPDEYKLSSVADRQELLAGLLDTDGYYGSGIFEIAQKSRQLADGICFVARSLGLAAYLKEKAVNGTIYYRVSISGDFTGIPFLRHKVTPRQQRKSVLHTGIRLESLGVGQYCGFEIDGDKLFLLGDFTVTHNTELIRYFEVGLLHNSKDTKLGLLHMEEMQSTTYRAMATYELGVNVRTKEDAKENGITEEKVIEAAKQIAEGERTVVFEMREHDSPMQLLEHVRLGATVYGVTHFFIDHVQRLAYLSNEGTDGATSTLTALGSRMAQLAKQLNIAVIFISQVNDDGRTKYAAALEEEAIVCIKIERDVEAESEKERNTTHFIIDKNRPFSQLGDAGSVYYNPETTILEEVIFDV